MRQPRTSCHRVQTAHGQMRTTLAECLGCHAEHILRQLPLTPSEDAWGFIGVRGVRSLTKSTSKTRLRPWRSEKMMLVRLQRTSVVQVVHSFGNFLKNHRTKREDFFTSNVFHISSWKFIKRQEKKRTEINISIGPLGTVLISLTV